MSIHALIAAAYVENLDAGRKWVLAAIADSADEFTLESAPGLPKLRAWSGLSESRTKSVVGELIAAGYVSRIEAGRVGRRAVYRVFPQGVPAIPRPAEVAARYAHSQPVDNSENEGATGGTTGPGGCHETPGRVPPAVPLRASTSVSSAQHGPGPVETRRPAPPSPGFPGARASSSAHDAREERRRARGAHNVPCPIHPDDVVPCRRCAHVAANADPQVVAAARQQARQATRAARAHTQEQP